MKDSVLIGICFFKYIFLVVVALDQTEICRRCMRAEKCAFYGQMSKQEQEKWLAKNGCENENKEEDVGKLFGFAPVAKGDYICCPAENVWGVEESGSDNNGRKPDSKDKLNSDKIYQDDVKESENSENESFEYEQNRSGNNRRPGTNRVPGNRRNNGRRPITHEQVINGPSENINRNPNGNLPTLNVPFQSNPIRGPQNKYPNTWNGPQGNGALYPNQNYPTNSQNSFSPPASFYRPPTGFQNTNNNLNFPQTINSPPNRQPNSFQNSNMPSPNFPQGNNNEAPLNFPNNNLPNLAGQNRNNVGRSPNGNFNNQGQFQTNLGGQNGNNLGRNPNGNFNNQSPMQTNFGGQNGNNQGKNPTGNFNNQGPIPNQFGSVLTSGGQCSALTSFPPQPQTGCCGRDATADRNIGNRPQNNFLNRRPASNQNQWSPMNSFNYPRQNRATRASGNESDVNVTLDNRITGGKETDLNQFPWLALLKTTFDYGSKQSAFNCGGSVISARYILTAAHCVQEDNARVTDVEIYLAEYDKRSFPSDCVNMFGEGRKCIENMVMHAEDVVPHPQYDDRKLQNDIALIRLRGNAPYSEYIRPICLPPVDIDNPDYSNLRVAIAGWGRNGRQTSQIKQSAIVHLVPQRECSNSYPQLTRRHLCAAGHSGEDTCKGDSGGPLMMLYEGQYYISGVVSGKRADSPCGTSVPSLYTNVYHYQDWIRSNIRN